MKVSAQYSCRFKLNGSVSFEKLVLSDSRECVPILGSLWTPISSVLTKLFISLKINRVLQCFRSTELRDNFTTQTQLSLCKWGGWHFLLDSNNNFLFILSQESWWSSSTVAAIYCFKTEKKILFIISAVLRTTLWSSQFYYYSMINMECGFLLKTKEEVHGRAEIWSKDFVVQPLNHVMLQLKNNNLRSSIFKKVFWNSDYIFAHVPKWLFQKRCTLTSEKLKRSHFKVYLNCWYWN